MVAAATLLLAPAACDDDPSTPLEGGAGGRAAFEVVVSGEKFVVEVETDAQIQAMSARLASGVENVISGPLLAGSGGFNAPWGWHLDPAQVHAADMAIELCDGRPSMVEADLGYWIDTVGQFCPWGAKVVARIR